MKAILAIRCYKQNGHKAWIALRDVGNGYDILMGVIQISDHGDPEVIIKPARDGKTISTLMEAVVDFKARCNFYTHRQRLGGGHGVPGTHGWANRMSTLRTIPPCGTGAGIPSDSIYFSGIIGLEAQCQNLTQFNR
jgi:hypothetical protein